MPTKHIYYRLWNSKQNVTKNLLADEKRRNLFFWTDESIVLRGTGTKNMYIYLYVVGMGGWQKVSVEWKPVQRSTYLDGQELITERRFFYCCDKWYALDAILYLTHNYPSVDIRTNGGNLNPHKVAL